MKLGFIGSGKMASALAQGVINAGLCQPGELMFADAIAAAAEKLAKSTGGQAARSNVEAAAGSDVLVLAVKPADAVAALQSLSSATMESTMRWAWKGDEAGNQKLLLSIVAGLPLSKLESAAGPKL